MTNLFAIVRSYESSAHVQRSVIGTGIAFANFFFCAYFERHVAGPVWQQGLVTLLAIETGLLVLVAMGVYLQVIDPILQRTRIHPVRPSAEASAPAASFPANVKSWPPPLGSETGASLRPA